MSFSTHMTPGQVLSDDCTIYDSRHVSTNYLTKGHRRAIKYSIARFIRTARPPPLANCKTAVPPKSPQPHVLFSLRVAVPSPSRWNRREGGSPRLCFTVGEGGEYGHTKAKPCLETLNLKCIILPNLGSFWWRFDNNIKSLVSFSLWLVRICLTNWQVKFSGIHFSE